MYGKRLGVITKNNELAPRAQHFFKFGDAPKALHGGVDVASVAKVVKPPTQSLSTTTKQSQNKKIRSNLTHSREGRSIFLIMQ